MPGPAPSLEPTPTERRMKKLLVACEKSGLSMAEFSRRRHLPPHRLRWWKYELERRAKRRRSHGRPSKGSSSPSLIHLPMSPVDLQISGGASASDQITVEFPSGLRVQVPRDCGAEELREILEAVRSSC